MLRFKPTMEAETPAGFPAHTPVGKVEVKQYPAYRMARFEMKEVPGGNNAFFTLFNHIKKNNIAMTAPVEMDYSATEGAKPRETSMAFLYASTEIGSLSETKSGVKVMDIPAKTVLSIGMRGPTSAAQVETARKALQSWLERHQDAYVADGSLRVMGYNSPFVFGNRRYFEVQIPLRAKDSKLGG